MRLALTPHPDSPARAVSGIAVEVERLTSGQLRLGYIVSGNTADIVLPPKREPGRADELWRHTVFEAFIRLPGAESYVEFNMSPSMHWAAYSFTGHRSGMRRIEGVRAPEVDFRLTGQTLEADVVLDLSGILADVPWRVGLTTIIEETDGRKSYWALAHPQGKADFHRIEGFALELLPAGRT